MSKQLKIGNLLFDANIDTLSRSLIVTCLEDTEEGDIASLMKREQAILLIRHLKKVFELDFYDMNYLDIGEEV